MQLAASQSLTWSLGGLHDFEALKHSKTAMTQALSICRHTLTCSTALLVSCSCCTSFSSCRLRQRASSSCGASLSFSSATAISSSSAALLKEKHMSLKTLSKSLLGLNMVIIAFVGLCCFPNVHHSKTTRILAGYHFLMLPRCYMQQRMLS